MQIRELRADQIDLTVEANVRVPDSDLTTAIATMVERFETNQDWTYIGTDRDDQLVAKVQGLAEDVVFEFSENEAIRNWPEPFVDVSVGAQPDCGVGLSVRAASFDNYSPHVNRDRIGRYELLDVLGTGSFATVWRAHDPVVGMDVAIKLLADNLAQNRHIRERFMAEARISLESNSTRMVRVHVVDETEDGQPYLVMALADRGSLEDRLRPSRQLGSHEAVSLAQQIALAVADMHRHGHIHRDLKPGNILFRTGPDGEELVLGDLGLAREFNKSAITLVSGTPGYVSPEQAAGVEQLTPQTDLFPIGVVLLEMLTGERPRKFRSMLAAATQDTIDVSPILDDARVGRPPSLDALVQDLVRLDPGKRPKSAHNVAEQLGTILEDIKRADPPRPATINPDPAEAVKLSDAVEPSEVVEPNDAVASLKESRLGLMLALAAAVIAIAAVVFVSTRPEANEESLAQPATEAATTVPTEAPVISTIPTPSDGALDAIDDVPLPEVAVVDRVRTEPGDRIVANVAGSVDDVAGFYDDLDGWTVLDRGTDGVVTSLLMTGDGPQFTVRLTPTALSSGSTTTNIVIEALVEAG